MKNKDIVIKIREIADSVQKGTAFAKKLSDEYDNNPHICIGSLN